MVACILDSEKMVSLLKQMQKRKCFFCPFLFILQILFFQRFSQISRRNVFIWIQCSMHFLDSTPYSSSCSSSFSSSVSALFSDCPTACKLSIKPFYLSTLTFENETWFSLLSYPFKLLFSRFYSARCCIMENSKRSFGWCIKLRFHVNKWIK